MSGRTVSLVDIAREWFRLGCIGFGGPPAHISLLRRLCVERRRWLGATEFEDAVAATNLLPGPASTQLAILCAWRLRGVAGAIVGGLGFILPGFALIVALSVLFLGDHPPLVVLGAAAGGGAAVPAVALHAAWRLVPGSAARRVSLARWIAYLVAGALTGALAGAWVVLVLVAAGLIEWLVRRPRTGHATITPALTPIATLKAMTVGTVGSLAWVAFKVGALSYGGGFVIIPLMQQDVVTTYHWMTSAQFLNAVALGQVTPGPVVLTVSAVGYAAGGIAGAALAAAVAFAPSFLFVITGAPRFGALRNSVAAQSFLAGAGAAVIGAIAGAAIPLATSLHAPWQGAVLAGALLWLFVARRGVVSCLLLSAAIGALVSLTSGL